MGCSARISIACKTCSQCGYTFRGGKEGCSTSTTPSNTPVGAALPPVLSPDSSAGFKSRLEAGSQSQERGGGEGSGEDALGAKPECDEVRADRLGGCATASASSQPSPRGEAASERVEHGASDADGGGRPTVTRVTPTALELHKKKEQDRRAKEKHLFACLQTLLFRNREKAPPASEVTYNYVLECAVTELRTRAGAQDPGAYSMGAVDGAADGSEGAPAHQAPGAGGETERHKVLCVGGCETDAGACGAPCASSASLPPPIRPV